MGKDVINDMDSHTAYADVTFTKTKCKLNFFNEEIKNIMKNLN